MAHLVYTIADGRAESGAQVISLRLQGAGIDIPAITVGEEGRGSSLGVVPVEGLPAGEGRLLAARIAHTRQGKPKLIAVAPETASPEAVLVVFRTTIGYRGGNRHDGGPTGWSCVCGAAGTGEPPAACPASQWHARPNVVYGPFPGRMLARGGISQGAAGRMGSGDQMVALIPKGAIFRIARSGRLYGQPGVHWARWDGTSLVVLTPEERALLDEW